MIASMSAREADDGSSHEPFGAYWEGPAGGKLTPYGRDRKELAEMPSHAGAFNDCEECQKHKIEADDARRKLEAQQEEQRLKNWRQQRERQVQTLAREMALAPIATVLGMATIGNLRVSAQRIYRFADAFIAEGERRALAVDEDRDPEPKQDGP